MSWDKVHRRAVAAAVAIALVLAAWVLLPVIAPLPGDLLDISHLVSTRIVDADGRLLHEYLSREQERLHRSIWPALARTS